MRQDESMGGTGAQAAAKRPLVLRQGFEILAMPGPTNVPDEVLNAMHRGPMDLYAGPLLDTTASCLSDLKRIMGTGGDSYIYAANGHGAWEAALSNVLSRGDRVLVLESGRFAIGWGNMASMMGITVEVLPGSWHRAVDPQTVEARLRADTKGEIKAVLVVQIDTASGVVNDIPAIRRAIDAAGHDALFMVDTIASLGCVPYRMDDWGVDVTVAACQKGLMTPPGLSFNAANAKAKAVHAGANLRTSYWDWTARDGTVHYMKYCGTPPEHHLFALRKAFEMIWAEGLDNVFARHRILAAATRAAVAKWAEGGAFDFNISEPSERSDSVTTVLMAEGRNPAPLRAWADQTCGVILGLGIGDLDGKAFRIAHMGHVNAPMALGVLGVVEAGLSALGIPHGKGGMQAAVDVISAGCAS